MLLPRCGLLSYKKTNTKIHPLFTQRTAHQLIAQLPRPSRHPIGEHSRSRDSDYHRVFINVARVFTRLQHLASRFITVYEETSYQHASYETMEIYTIVGNFRCTNNRAAIRNEEGKKSLNGFANAVMDERLSSL